MASSDSSDYAVTILTCDADERLFQFLLRGLNLYWPSAQQVVLRDDNTEAESDIPDDIRKIARKWINLRRVFDLPMMTDAKWLCFMDVDCLVLGPMPAALQPSYLYCEGMTTMTDQVEWLQTWRAMGVKIPNPHPKFSGAMYTIGRQDLLDHREESFEYIRQAERLGISQQWSYEGIMSGIWRRHYPNNPLPPRAYSQLTLTRGMRMTHLGLRCNVGSGITRDNPDVQSLLRQYSRLLATAETNRRLEVAAQTHWGVTSDCP